MKRYQQLLNNIQSNIDSNKKEQNFSSVSSENFIDHTSIDQTKSEEDIGDFTKVDDMEEESTEMELMEYKKDFYEMSLGSIRAIASHAQAILNSLDAPHVKENLTESWLQGRIAITEDYMRTIHDYLMFSGPEDDDTSTEAKKKKDKKMPPFAPPLNTSPTMPGPVTVPAVPAGAKPGLWDNIRKKKERDGKNYKPAKPGDKDRPDPEMWKKLTKEKK